MRRVPVCGGRQDSSAACGLLDFPLLERLEVMHGIEETLRNSKLSTIQTLRSLEGRYEYGTRNTSDHAGWARAIEFWEGEIGWENVWRAVEEYVMYLMTALTGTYALDDRIRITLHCIAEL